MWSTTGSQGLTMSLMFGHIQTVMGQSLRMEIGLYVYIGMINKEETWNFFQLEAKIDQKNGLKNTSVPMFLNFFF